MTKSNSGEKINNGVKKGPWTPEEDQKLVDYIQKHGHGKWRTLPKNAGLKRCGKSCRLRWANYLRPDIKRGKFSLEEEEAIIQLHSVLGNKWSTIAANLPGRTDNEIKNYWNTHIKKKLLKMGLDPVTHTPRLDILHLTSILNSSLYNSPQFNNNNGLLGMDPSQLQLLNLFTTLLSCQNRNQDACNSNNYQKNQQWQHQSQCSQPIMQLDGLTLSSMKTELDHQTSPVTTPFSDRQNVMQSLLQYNGSPISDTKQPEPSATQCVSSLSKFSVNNLLESPTIFCNNEEILPPNFNLSSLLSSATPSSSSSPSTLNNNSSTSTTFINGNNEDERDTYASNMFMYNISNGLNDSGLL